MQCLEHRARSFFLRCRTQSSRVRPTRDCSRIPQKSFQAPCFSTSTSSRDNNTAKPFYVTTPIYYVNSAPHVGHLYSMVLADVLKRWHQLKREQAQLLTGTDEHGIKVQRAAEAAGVDTYTFCTETAKQFMKLADAGNISYDRFFRTTDADHKEAVSFFWKELNSHGYIYEAKHEGWYCVSDETFYPESQVHMILDPATGEKVMASVETGKDVIWTSEINYHFRLSAFRDQLLQHYKDNPEFIVPRQRMNFVIKEVETALTDLSISRPKERLSWGIPVPDDPSQTIYVWFDALINYITHAGYPFAPPDEQGPWPADVQVIGKDIIRFHTIYWPAFLMAIGLPVPTQYLCHAHWTMNTQKMSKSLGNVVNPFGAINRFGVDPVRYYMVRDGGFADDAPYENSYIIRRYKTELQGQLGNLLNRIVRGSMWDVAGSVTACKDELALAEDQRSQRCKEYETDLKESLLSTVKAVDGAMQSLDVRDATDRIVGIVQHANQRFQQTAPWSCARNEDQESKNLVQWSIFEVAESLRIVLILLQPFMPEKMSLALDMLGVAPEDRYLTADLVEKIPSYGEPLINMTKGTRQRRHLSEVLFPPLLQED